MRSVGTSQDMEAMDAIEAIEAIEATEAIEALEINKVIIVKDDRLSILKWNKPAWLVMAHKPMKIWISRQITP